MLSIDKADSQLLMFVSFVRKVSGEGMPEAIE